MWPCVYLWPGVSSVTCNLPRDGCNGCNGGVMISRIWKWEGLRIFVRHQITYYIFQITLARDKLNHARPRPTPSLARNHYLTITMCAVHSKLNPVFSFTHVLPTLLQWTLWKPFKSLQMSSVHSSVITSEHNKVFIWTPISYFNF